LAQTDSTIVGDSGDEDWGLLMFGLIGILFICISIGVGIAITFILLGFLTVLISMGIVSAAIWYGWYKKSIEKGFNVFVIATSAALTTFIGTLGLLVLNHFFNWFHYQHIFIYGVGAFVCVGILLGIFILFIIKKIIIRMIHKYNIEI
jgi:hypothetical protein